MGLDLDKPIRTYEDAGMPVDGDPLTADRITPREILNWGGARVYRDTNGRINWRWVTNTAGVVPVTEASGALIASRVLYSALGTKTMGRALIAQKDIDGIDQYYGPRIGRARITCDGAGAWANESLVPALAGYYGVMRMKSVKANNIAAAASLTYESPAATPALPSIEVLPALAANVRIERSEVVTHATLVDAQAIVVDGAGFGAGTIVDLEWEYWYES